MEELNLAQYRKIMILVFSAGIIFVLQRYGLTADDLPVYGFAVGDIAAPVVDFLLQIGVPAVLTLAQPNENGETIFRYWIWVVGGLAVVALLIALLALFAPVNMPDFMPG